MSVGGSRCDTNLRETEDPEMWVDILLPVWTNHFNFMGVRVSSGQEIHTLWTDSSLDHPEVSEGLPCRTSPLESVPEWRFGQVWVPWKVSKGIVEGVSAPCRRKLRRRSRPFNGRRKSDSASMSFHGSPGSETRTDPFDYYGYGSVMNGTRPVA